MSKRFTSTTFAYVGAYLFFLLVLLGAHYARVFKDPALIGEELASGYRNAVYWEFHLQSDGFATTYSSHFFFWLGSKVLPVTINSARIFKIILTALLGPILLALMRWFRPGISAPAAWFPVLLVPLLPTISWYGIMGFEYIIDLTCAFAALLLALRFDWNEARMRFVFKLFIFCALIGFTLHLYSGALPVLVVSCGAMLWRLWIVQHGYRHWSRSGAFSLLFLSVLTLICAWPYYYYYDEYLPVLRGGGQLIFTKEALWENFFLNYLDLFERSSSYLIGGYLDYPCFPILRGGLLVFVLMFFGLLWLRRYRDLRWLLLIGVLSLAVTLLVSSTPGIRRGLPFVVVVCLLAGLGLDWISERENPVTRKRLGMLVLLAAAFSCADFYSKFIPWWSPALLAVILSVVCRAPRVAAILSDRRFVPRLGVCFIIAPFATYVGTYVGIVEHYEAWLQREFKYYPSMNYEETIEEMLRRMQIEEIEFSTNEYHHDTLVLLDLMCRRRKLSCIPPKVAGSGWTDARITLFSDRS